MLFSSCQQYDTAEELEVQQLTFEEFTVEHFAISKRIVELYSKEKNINLETLGEGLQNVNNREEFLEVLKSSNVKNHTELSDLFQRLVTNNEKFRNTNPEYFGLNEEQRLSLLTNKIDELSNNDYLQTQRLGSCEDARATAENRCSRNFAIATGVAFVSGLITLGWGTAIGWGAAWVMATACLIEAGNDYDTCLENL